MEHVCDILDTQKYEYYLGVARIFAFIIVIILIGVLMLLCEVEKIHHRLSHMGVTVTINTLAEVAATSTTSNDNSDTGSNSDDTYSEDCDDEDLSDEAIMEYQERLREILRQRHVSRVVDQVPPLVEEETAATDADGEREDPVATKVQFEADYKTFRQVCHDVEKEEEEEKTKAGGLILKKAKDVDELLKLQKAHNASMMRLTCGKLQQVDDMLTSQGL